MSGSPAAALGAADPSGWKSLHGQTGLLAAGYLARSAGSLVLAVVLSRALGADGYGQVGVFLALSWGLFYVTGSWLLVAVPALGAEPDGPGASSVMWMAAAAAALALLACLAVLGAGAIALDADAFLSRGAWPVVAAAAMVLLGLHGLYSLLQATGDAASVALLQGADRIAATALVVIALALHADDPVVAMWAMTVGSALAVALGLWLPPTRRHLRRPVRDLALLRRTLTFSAPLVVTNVCAYVVGWAGVLVLALFAEDRDVGVFALASQIYALPLALAGMWVLAAVPAYARGRAAAGARPSADRVELASRWWALAMGACGLLAVLLFVPLFGEQFEPSRSMLAVLLVGAASVGFYYAATPVMIAEGRARALMHLSVAGAIATVVLDVALVGPLGPWAAVVGAVVQTVAVSAALAVDAHGAGGLRRMVRSIVVPVAALGLAAAWPDRAWALAASAACLAVALVVAIRRTPPDLLRGARA